MLDFDQDDLTPVGNVRRDMLKRLLGVGALAALTPDFMQHAIAADTAAKTLLGPKVPDVKPTRLTDKIYIIKAHDKFPTPENLGFFTNITFLVTSKGVVVLDPSASVEIGRMAIRMIKTVTPKPVIAVINTHYHGDHWMGNQAFAEQFPGIPMYSMKESAEAIKNVLGEQWIQMALRMTNKATRGTIITPPNAFIKDGDVLDFGDTKLNIHHYGKCHTPYDLLVEFTGTPYMHVGDVLMGHRMAGMGDNEGSFLEGLRVLNKVKSNFGDRTFIPGDLPPTGRTKLTEVESINMENDGHEDEPIHRRADHRVPAPGRGRDASQGRMPSWRLQRRDVLQVARQVRRHGGVGGSTAA